MKRIVFTIFLSFMISLMYGQSMLGLRGGFAITSLSSGSAKMRPTFNVGAIYSTQISDKWHFQPSLLFSLNGVKASDSSPSDYSAYFYSVETPLQLSYRAGDEDISIGLDMGPFLRYGLFGGYWTDSENGRIKPNIFDHQKRFDIGPQIGFSVMAHGMYIGYSFQYGLIKPWDDKRGHYYNSSVNLGYLFSLY